MGKKSLLVCLLALSVGVASKDAAACAGHLYLDTQNMGFFGRTAARMVGLAPPERVFKVKHPSTTLANTGEEMEIQVSYQRPFFAKEVRLELSGSSSVLLAQDTLQLKARTGEISIRFQVTAPGYNTINLTVVGENKGEIVREHSRIYVRAKQKPTADDMQVSVR